MTLSGDVQTDFNSVVLEIGGSVIVYSNVKSYNIYGDYANSGTSLYVSGVTVMASIQPRTQDDLELKAFGDRVNGTAIGYFQSGTAVNVGYRVSGIPGDYKVNAVNGYYVNDVLVYNMVLLDKLNK